MSSKTAELITMKVMQQLGTPNRELSKTEQKIQQENDILIQQMEIEEIEEHKSRTKEKITLFELDIEQMENDGAHPYDISVLEVSMRGVEEALSGISSRLGEAKRKLRRTQLGIKSREHAISTQGDILTYRWLFYSFMSKRAIARSLREMGVQGEKHSLVKETKSSLVFTEFSDSIGVSLDMTK